ncbi:ABC transporter ATP-binding protein [Actinotalea solisilvae]|uniref:ABC transporter ATP-binding protein n=1 Tax=Actinotalea solisilvae TaxID=2072922 RepID=UPI0018F1E487|nr:ABC transporter ATP-binding protein [Actinotalea solisilvae]
MNTTPAVQVRDLHKHYGAKRAVDGLDLTVEAGEVFAVLGPNGAGKTTTIEILEGYRDRDSGDVTVLGVDPRKADRAWRSRVGIVLQSADDQAELTVRELVRHVARFYPSPRDPDELVEAVGLTAKAGTRVRQLSGGQRRRLDVALGIVGRPELLFLDEPTTGFDPEARRSFWDLLRGLRDDGTTILLTTHYLDEAEQLADRVAVVRDGRVVALDAPRALGGRATHEALVRWHEAGEVREVRTPTPTALVADLVRRFAPGEVTALEVLRPTLEDVYLEMVGERTSRASTAQATTDTPAPADLEESVR